MSTTSTHFPHLTIILPGWDLEVVLIKTPKGTYSPLPPLCKQLGDIDTFSQVEKLQADPTFAPFLEQLEAPTKTGYRDSWCLRRFKLGDWFHSINPNKVRTELRDHLDEINALITQNSDRTLFKKVADLIDPAPPSPKASKATKPPASSVRAEVYIQCECGRHHRIVFDNLGGVQHDTGMGSPDDD